MAKTTPYGACDRASRRRPARPNWRADEGLDNAGKSGNKVSAHLGEIPSYPRRTLAYLANGDLPPPPCLRSMVCALALGVTAGGAFMAILALAVLP